MKSDFFGQVYEIEFGTPEYDESLRLRSEILREPLGLEFTEDGIEKEWDCIHIGFFGPNGEVVGTLMLEKQTSDRKLKMRQVAVKLEYQSQGIGKQLVHYAETWALNNHFSEISLMARSNAVPFYQSLGYHIFKEKFIELGIPHYGMSKQF